MSDKELGILENQFKSLGIKEAFTRELVDQLKTLPKVHVHQFSKSIDGNQVNASLLLKKSEQSNLYFINRNDMQVIREGMVQPVTQAFNIYKDNKYTFKESYNLVMGRPVYSKHANKEGEEYQSWSKINFKNQLANGNFEMKQYNDNYGFKLENVLAKYPIKELANEQYKASLISSLNRGNLQSVTFIGNDNKEEKLFISPNIVRGSLNVYDRNGLTVSTEQLVEKNFIGKDFANELKQRIEKLNQKQEAPKESVKIETPAKDIIAKDNKLAQKIDKPAKRQRVKIK